MIELRWVALGKSRHLQYRFVTPNVDASGGFCPPGEWSAWQDVPTIDVNDVAMEDLVTAGGIVGAP